MYVEMLFYWDNNKHVNVKYFVLCWVMVFNAAFHNMSTRSWLSVLLLEDTGVPGQIPPTFCMALILSHNVVSSNLAMNGILSHNFSGHRHRLRRYQLPSDHGHSETYYQLVNIAYINLLKYFSILIYSLKSVL
jgi:hypothetical protein